MKIQAANKGSEPSFQKFVVYPGSFDALKKSKYFPPKTDVNYKNYLLTFYKGLKQIKKNAEQNNIYDVVLKPDSLGGGKLVIEREGKEQAGFSTSFENLFDIEKYIPQKKLTPQQEPNILRRYLKNYFIDKSNKKLEQEPINYKLVFDTITKKIARYADEADYLKELADIKRKERKM